MTDRDRSGLEASPAFRAYMARLRSNWPANPELAAKHGVPAGNGRFHNINMSETETGETDAQTAELIETTGPHAGSEKPIGDSWSPTRRQMMIATGATMAALGGAGLASAQGDETINHSSEYAHDPYIEASVEVTEHDGSMSELEYINDEGQTEALGNSGIVLAQRADDDEPHNPVSYSATSIDADEYRDLPRGVTEDDADGDEIDVSWLDADRWSIDEAASAGSMSLTEDSDVLTVDVAGQADGDVVVATFDHADFEIDSGELRKYLQVVANVVDLPADTSAEIRVRDSTDTTAGAVIDSAADTATTAVIANEIADGVLYQEQLGELASDLETIEAVEIEVADGDLTLDLHGLNVERESRWELGERETLDDDDEVESETVRSSTGGPISITSLETIDSPFSSATIYDVEYQVEQRASELPDDDTMVLIEDAGRHAEGDRDTRVTIVHQFEFPTGYDLSWSVDAMVDETRHPSSRYRTAEFATDAEELETFDDVDDEDWTDRTDEYGSGDIGDELELTSLIDPDERTAVHFDLILTESEAEEMTQPVGGGAAALSGGDGPWYSSPMAILGGVFTGIVAWFGGLRDMVGGD